MESNKGKIMGLTYLLNERKIIANLNKQTVQAEYSNLKAASAMMMKMSIEKLETKVNQIKQKKNQTTKQIEVALERKEAGLNFKIYLFFKTSCNLKLTISF